MLKTINIIPDSVLETVRALSELRVMLCEQPNRPRYNHDFMGKRHQDFDWTPQAREFIYTGHLSAQEPKWHWVCRSCEATFTHNPLVCHCGSKFLDRKLT